MFKITIIISINNFKVDISESFNSILNQSIGFENLQVIFVNNSPNDIVKKYSIEFPNVISIEVNQNNVFEGQLNNIGMNQAIGDYVLFLNPSKKLNENACELLYNNILKEGYDFVCGLKNIDYDDMDEINLDFNMFYDNPLLINDLTVNNVLFKKSFLINNYYDSLDKYYEFDSTFIFNVLLDTNKKKFFRGSIVKDLNSKSKMSKESIKEFIDASFEMYHISLSKNKKDYFINNVLFYRLNYFTKYLLNNDLTITDILDILSFSKIIIWVVKETPLRLELVSLFNLSSKNSKTCLGLISTSLFI